MPYILVRCSSPDGGYDGYPTFIDYHAEGGEQGEFKLLKDVMSHLRASSLSSRPDLSYCSYRTFEPPYLVLNRLETQGYKVVASNSAAYATRLENCVLQFWTLHKQR